MGMFDYVEFEYACPECGKVIRNWQSKDGDRALSNLTPSDVDNFYTSCDECMTWIEFVRTGLTAFRLEWHNMEDCDAESHAVEDIVVAERKWRTT